MLDKYHRRRVHEVRVRCRHKEFGCDWVGEVNWWKRHDDSCPKRPWECEYCGLKCTYEEGEGKHWPTCHKFPEPCPNMCEVGSVERCNMEQHLSVCPLEPVACEMKEFGCSVVVPRKELARHMRESELQHLTAMTVMNLRLTRQQDSTERDRKIAQLQQEMTDQKKLLTELTNNLQAITANFEMKIDEQKRELTELKNHIQKVQLATNCIETERVCSGWDPEVFTFTQYSKWKDSDAAVSSDPFYSHFHGYKLRLGIQYFSPVQNDINVFFYLIKGEYDDEVLWPVEIKVQLEILNQAGDHDHVVGIKKVVLKDKNDMRGEMISVPGLNLKEQRLEMQCGVIQYVTNDCLKFGIDITTITEVQGTNIYCKEKSETVTFTEYSKRKCSDTTVSSDPFDSHNSRLILQYTHHGISVHFRSMKSRVFNERVQIKLKLLNQAGDHNPIVEKHLFSNYDRVIDAMMMKMDYSDLERQYEPDIQYVMDDCIKLRLHITTKPKNRMWLELGFN